MVSGELLQKVKEELADYFWGNVYRSDEVHWVGIAKHGKQKILWMKKAKDSDDDEVQVRIVSEIFGRPPNGFNSDFDGEYYYWNI